MTLCNKPKADRYARYWCWTSKLTKQITGGLCCYPGCENRTTETHHAAYLEKDERDRLIPTKGREIPGVHVFGLCDRHHSRFVFEGAHHPINWTKGIVPPDYLDALQKPHFYCLLVEGFKEKSERARNNRNFSKSERECYSKVRPKPILQKTRMSGEITP